MRAMYPGLRRRCASVLAGVMLALPMVVSATGNPFSGAKKDLQTAAKGAGTPQQVSDSALEDTVGALIQGALSILGVVFFGYMVWAGYLWMTAHGESDKIEKAKEMLKNATIGLGITLAAYAIAGFVLKKVTEAGGIQ